MGGYKKRRGRCGAVRDGAVRCGAVERGVADGAGRFVFVTGDPFRGVERCGATESHLKRPFRDVKRDAAT